MDSENIFQLKNISKVFGISKEVEVHALNDVSLEIKKGEFTAIVGPSGSGKSTLLNIMSGLDTPSEGDVFLKGCNMAELSGNELSDFRRDHIGFIFQAYNLIPVLTVMENIEYVMLLQSKNKDLRRARVLEILDEVGLKGFENRMPLELSGGQQQRVAVARAMVSKPDIILADEPTANLDSSTGTSLVEMMKGLNEKFGSTFIFSTHDPIIMKRAKRLITLKDGAILEDEVR